MALGGANLLLDQVKIIEQPFPGRRNWPICRNGRGELFANPYKYFFVVGQPCQQLIAGTQWGELVRARQRLAVLLHLVGTQ